MANFEEQIQKLQEIYDNSRSIVFFGGAGVSTESGIKDFRSTDGLYHMQYKYPPEEILSHFFFLENTEEFYRFYNERILTENSGPNAAHKALAEMERKGKLSAVITQNIDGLHQEAGSHTVLELHGTVLKNHCLNCGKEYPVAIVKEAYQEGKKNGTSIVPRCPGCGGLIKPDVVLYEESLNENLLTRAVIYLQNADTLIIGGTSLVVYPAAGLIQYFNGKNLVLINRDSTPADAQADLVIHDSIGKVLGSLKL